MYLPSTKAELKTLGWKQLDIILVTGDAYIDSPFVGVALVGRVLADAGYRVGIIGQPDVSTDSDITRLGEPRLFWGVSGGCIDSMVANYTALKKKRRSDDYTPGGINNRRPDRAVIVYSNLIRRCFKDTVPIVLGGIEASLRRVVHYDYWSDKLRKSILFDAKADYLLYGMADRSVVVLADRLSQRHGVSDLPGLCYISREKPDDYVELSSFQEVSKSKSAFTRAYHAFYRNSDPITARGLCQKQDSRWLVQTAPQAHLSQQELDSIYALPFERDLHPFHRAEGKVKALETIRFSIATHRGCYGECNFCSIAVHEGRTVLWRSEKSIKREACTLTELPGFKGYIYDAGGPSANMYGFECARKLAKGICPRKRCVFPRVCKSMPVDHSAQTKLLGQLRKIPGVKKVFVASGVRHDLVLADKTNGESYLRNLVRHHVSGQMKIAPEHTSERVLECMLKPPASTLLEFREMFIRFTREAGKDQYLTYYLIAAHPGCSQQDMKALAQFSRSKLKITPEQVQIFTPLPSTYSALMYYTGRDPFSGKRIFVERSADKKKIQKAIVTERNR